MRIVREQAQMTRGELARRTGTSESVIWKMEHGHWGWDILMRVVRTLGVQVFVQIRTM